MTLQWVSDEDPGLRRLRSARGFRYVDAEGRPVRCDRTLARIRALAIPPAYQQVWICPRPDGYLQATGRDARGRKQYRYHPEWVQRRGEDKFGLLREFAQGLPKLRRRVRQQLRAVGAAGASSAGSATELGRERVIAALVRLLDHTWARIGNRGYARENGSYGLSTLLCRHVRVQGDALLLNFRGKSGVRHELAVRDEQLATLVRRCRDLPGQELFCYQDESGAPHRIDAADVNAWLARVAGPACSAKVFRTWHASVLALDLLARQARAGAAAEDGPAALKQVLAQVADRLGNTVAVCRKAYVHPAVLAWAQDLPGLARQRWLRQPPALAGLSQPERRLLGLLRSRGGGKA